MSCEISVYYPFGGNKCYIVLELHMSDFWKRLLIISSDVADFGSASWSYYLTLPALELAYDHIT
jgi:hypothetical protein